QVIACGVLGRQRFTASAVRVRGIRCPSSTPVPQSRRIEKSAPQQNRFGARRASAKKGVTGGREFGNRSGFAARARWRWTAARDAASTCARIPLVRLRAQFTRVEAVAPYAHCCAEASFWKRSSARVPDVARPKPELSR